MSELVSISAASLNFSGINTNPFQFDDGTPIFKDLNKSFLLIKHTEFPNITKWVGAPLDKHFKRNRFTVLFGEQILQSIGDKLPSQEEFGNKWHLYYKNAVENQKLNSNYQSKPEEVEDVFRMDFAFYRAVVMAVYNYKTLQQYNERYADEESLKLKEFLRHRRASPPFQLSIKKQFVQKYYHTVDILFLQQAGSVEWQQEEGYTLVKNHDAVIIYKTNIFGKLDQRQTKKWQNLLDINDDSVVALTKKGYLLLSSHFKSSLPFYKQQQAELFKVLNYVIDYYDYKPYKLIIGVDANHRIDYPKINQKNYIVPNKPEDTSSIKKRSYIQAQMHKADQAVDELKDHIITTLEIKEYGLELIDGSPSNKELLPNDRHPYDHFIVKAKLIAQ